MRRSATPVLVIGLGAIGLSAWAAGIDYVVVPALLLSLGLLGIGLYWQRRIAL
ncbi:mercury resistance system transport protein MerF [Methylobacterium isbiliense]|uniref:mercury resistance system transport protein MerF n=1 Tax=Methylobacterium isbiliense TaxID=315478 RepID=UPI003F494383